MGSHLEPARSRHAAAQVLRELDDALESLELYSKEGYKSHMDLQLQEISAGVPESTGQRKCPDLRRARDDRNDADPQTTKKSTLLPRPFKSMALISS